MWCPESPYITKRVGRIRVCVLQVAWGIQEPPCQAKFASSELILSPYIVISILKDIIKQGHH